MNIILSVTLLSLLLSKILLSTWVYKDAKSRGINPFIWTILILFFSSSLAFLLYVLVVRKERYITCQKCNFTQSDKLLYCGRCGNEIKIDKFNESTNIGHNRIFLGMGIVLLALGLLTGIIFSVITFQEDMGNIPISIMSVSSKYNDKWKDKFKYKNGEWSHDFKISERTILNSSWDVNDGYIEAKLYKDNELIKEINSEDYPNYKELIDLKEYKGSKVTLQLKFKKASGKIEFFLE